MDASSIFATGGASGVVGVVGFLIYRFFFSKHRITSRCCGRELSIETEGSTPNIKPIVDEAPKSQVSSGNEGQPPRRRSGQSAPPQSGDGCGIPQRQGASGADKEEGQATAEAGVQERTDGASRPSGAGSGVPA